VGIDPAALRPLRAFTWVLHADGEYDRLAADAGGHPTPALLGRSLFVRLWREEMRAGR
jgi:hypothetical protein